MHDTPLTITIDGQTCTAVQGEMLLETLRRHGVEVPTLCHDDRLTPYGGCRLCVVARRDGRGGLVPACSTPVDRGMVIETGCPEVVESRRRQLQLLVLNHRMECPVCERSGSCRFQDLIYRYGTPEDLLPFDRAQVPVDRGSPVIVRDAEKCVVCGKCVRLCHEIQGIAAIGLTHRGLQARVTTLLEQPLDCEFCGQCVDACPVAALSATPFSAAVPAWMRTTITTTCSYCSCGCQLTVESHDGRLQRVTAPAQAEPNHANLCVKGRFGWDLLRSPERLTRPLVRRDGRLVETTWEEALSAAAAGLAAARDGGRPVVGIGTPRLTTEDAYLMQRLLRGHLGTPHVSAGLAAGAAALVEGVLPVTGAARSTASFADLRAADLVLVLRADPTRTHPLVKNELVQGLGRRGQRVVLANGLGGGLERHATRCLTTRPGSEDGLVRGLVAAIVDDGRIDAAASELPELERLTAELAGWGVAAAADHTGVAVADIRALAAELASAQRLVVVVATGLGIPGDEAAVARAAADLLLLLGRLEGDGNGLLVLGAKANVQGVLDAGLHPARLPGGRPVGDTTAAADCGRLWGAAPPTEVGWTAPEAMARAAAGEVGALWLVGQDPTGSWPTAQGGRSRPRADFVLVQDAFLTATAEAADVVLPVALLVERGGTVTGADGVVRALHPALPAPAGLPGDGDLFLELAARLGATLPAAGDAAHELSELTAAGRVERPHLAELLPVGEPSTVDGTALDLSPQLFHSGTVTLRSRTLRQLSPTVALRLAREDARALGATAGDLVRIATPAGEATFRVRVDRTVRPGVAGLAWTGDCAHLVHDDREVAAVEIRRSE